MNDNDEPKSRSGGFERHAQTIIGGVLLALFLWAGSTLLDVRLQLSRIEGRLASADGRDRTVDAEFDRVRARLRDIELEMARTNAAKGQK